MHLTVVGHSAITVDQFQQVDVAGAECERRGGIEFTLDTHIVGRVDDVLDAHFLSQFDGDGVDTLCEGHLQGHRVAREIAVGIRRGPGCLLLLRRIPDLHCEVGVVAAVAGRETLIHRLGIDEEFERGSRLAHRRHLVVFPRVEVHVAHPGLYVPRLSLHRHEATVHEAYHIADGVHRRHLLLYLATVVVEQLHRVGQVQVVVDGVLVARKLLGEQFVVGLALGDVLDEMGDLHVMLILPGIGRAPVVVEVLLHLHHLLAGSLLGVFLHTGVDGGVDLQAVGIEVVAVVLAPFPQVVGHRLAEVGSLTVVGVLHAVVEVDLEFLQRVADFLGQVAVLRHQVEYDVAALQRVLRIDQRIIIGGGLQHTHQHSGFLSRQFPRRAAEVGLAGSLDTKGI